MLAGNIVMRIRCRRYCRNQQKKAAGYIHDGMSMRDECCRNRRSNTTLDIYREGDLEMNEYEGRVLRKQKKQHDT